MPITRLLTREDTPESFITPTYKSRDHQRQNPTSQKSRRRAGDAVVTQVALYLALKLSPQLQS